MCVYWKLYVPSNAIDRKTRTRFLTSFPPGGVFSLSFFFFFSFPFFRFVSDIHLDRIDSIDTTRPRSHAPTSPLIKPLSRGPCNRIETKLNARSSNYCIEQIYAFISTGCNLSLSLFSRQDECVVHFQSDPRLTGSQFSPGISKLFACKLAFPSRSCIVLNSWPRIGLNGKKCNVQGAAFVREDVSNRD